MERRPWHDAYPDGIPASMDVPKVPIHGLLEETARERPDDDALIFFGQRTTFGELWDRVLRFAGGLEAAGIGPGDRVALMLPNTPHFLVGLFGTLAAGATAVPTNPMYTAEEIERQWGDADVRAAATLDVFWDQVGPATAGMDTVVVGDVGEELPFPLGLLYPIKRWMDHGRIDVPYGDRVRRFPAFLGPRADPVEVDPAEDVALIQYTGGTTGQPKGAVHVHRNLVANATAAALWTEMAPGDRVLTVMPMYHVYGLLVALASLHKGVEQILHPDPRETDAVLELIDELRPGGFPGVPALFVAINEHPDRDEFDLSCLEWALSAAAPLAQEVKEDFEAETGVTMLEGYGLTEAPAVCINPFDRKQTKAGTIGVPLPDTDVRLVDLERGEEEVPTGEPGELVVNGPQVMQGYHEDPERTANVLEDGWFRTGDVAVQDEDGFLEVVDRKKDMIITGGFNVYPREVEDVLFEHPAIAEAAVFDLPDPKRGQAVACALVLKEGETLSPDEVTGFCRDHLTGYKVPREVFFLDELPKSAVQKTLRRKLRDRFADETGTS